MTANASYIVAGCKPWNRQAFDRVIQRYPGTWHYIDDPRRLSVRAVRARAPRMLFFLHWSWKVPSEIVDEYECVNFHMTDVPYGRGGSPLQNLIVRGHDKTKLSALRMTGDFDAGPVYLKRTLSLAGNAEEIYRRASDLSAVMIGDIVRGKRRPVPQKGRPVVFRRRRPEESEIPEGLDVRRLYDFIRMLDAEGYPRAFLRQGRFRIELDRAVLTRGTVTARATITTERDKKRGHRP